MSRLIEMGMARVLLYLGSWEVEVVVHGPPRPPPRLDAGPGVLGRGPGHHGSDMRYVGEAEANGSDPTEARVLTTEPGTKTSLPCSSPAFSDLDESSTLR